MVGEGGGSVTILDRIRKLPVNFISEHAQCQSAFHAL